MAGHGELAGEGKEGEGEEGGGGGRRCGAPWAEGGCRRVLLGGGMERGCRALFPARAASACCTCSAST
jgi:hypothetical protein